MPLVTIQVLIVSVAAFAIVAAIAFAKWRIDADALIAQEARARASEQAGVERRKVDAEAKAAMPRAAFGPEDGAKLGIHIGGQLIQGTRVMRGAREAEGWIVLDDAELLEGVRATPLGGRQWIPAGSWMQEL